jgi:hypothetical protein
VEPQVLVAATDPLVVALATALLSGGLLSALVAFLRAKPQGQLDVVTAAKDLYDRVEDDNERLRQENKTLQGLLEDQAGLNEQLIRQLRYCNDEIDRLKAV